MTHLRSIAGVLTLSLALALIGCGQADQNASLTVKSVPQAEVFIDGVSHGQSGQVIALPAGAQKVELKVDGFKTFETTVTLAASETKTIEASLDSIDPSGPSVLAKLMASEGLEMAPWVAPETTRGRAGKQAVAVLLWPAKDVRKDGLINFAVEADEAYGGDASLEFRSGRKVLYREKFNPESVTTVRPIPAEVLEHVKVNSKIKWGLYFEDSRRPITSDFKVVRRTKAERQLEKVRKSRHMKRQPVITRKIAEAVILENNRLYSEALVANLSIIAAHPNSSQPLRGIVTTLRRLEAESSELFATVAPHVSGKGQRGLVARENGLGITAWSPIQKGALPTATIADATGGAKSDGRGVTPTTGSKTGSKTGSTETPSEGTTSEDGMKANPMADAQRAQKQLDGMTAERDTVQQDVTNAQQASVIAADTATAAEAKAKDAEAAATEARKAVEDAAAPTREQQEQMVRSGMAAEEAREAANTAREAAQAAEAKALALESDMDRLNQNIADMQRVLDATNGAGTPSTGVPSTGVPSTGVPSTGTSPKTGAEPTAKAPTDEELGKAFNAAKTASDNANTELTKAAAAFQAAQEEHSRAPSATTEANLENAQRAANAAKAEADRTRKALEAAQQAAGGIGSQLGK